MVEKRQRYQESTKSQENVIIKKKYRPSKAEVQAVKIINKK